MNKNKIASILLVLLGLIIAGGSVYLVLSYATDIMNAIVEFVSSNDLSKLDKCGISTPPQFMKMRADLTTVILPFLYIGMPLILLVLSMLMFMAGFYYHRARHEDEYKKNEEMERQMVHKLVKKIGVSKPPEEEEAPSTEIASEPEPEPEEEEEAPPLVKPGKKARK
jgi:hypothetical protein